jgi:nucleoside-diphosphate-sugar epimerase
MLISGTRSGLGKYLHENLGGCGLDRDNFDKDIGKANRKGADVIIHCAFNSANNIDAESLYSYLYDNVLLTQKLVSVPHKKFIFISTVDVYPKNGIWHTEKEDKIDVSAIAGLYALTKLMSESIIINNCVNYLILRSTSLLGKYSRRNSLIKIIKEKNCKLTLSANSKLNYVLHSDMLNFIRYAISHRLKGIYNIASSKNINLSEIAGISGNKVRFGKYHYDVGNISNRKVVSVFPEFNKTSREVIERFIGEIR